MIDNVNLKDKVNSIPEIFQYQRVRTLYNRQLILNSLQSDNDRSFSIKI